MVQSWRLILYSWNCRSAELQLERYNQRCTPWAQCQSAVSNCVDGLWSVPRTFNWLCTLKLRSTATLFGFHGSSEYRFTHALLAKKMLFLSKLSVIWCNCQSLCILPTDIFWALSKDSSSPPVHNMETMVNFQMAVGVLAQDNCDNWTWFLSQLKAAIGRYPSSYHNVGQAKGSDWCYTHHISKYAHGALFKVSCWQCMQEIQGSQENPNTFLACCIHL